MAMKFYNVEKVAELLGITPAEVNEMRERQELHGYRDGADWKFKADDIDQMAASKTPDAGGDDQEDILLTEVELGQSNPSASGTVLGPAPPDALNSSLSGDALNSSLSGFEDLDLSIADSGLDMSGLDMSAVSSLTGMSELDLKTNELDDDDLVLGASGSGSGSDLTTGGDSGISLIDPSDSGISLEEPLELGGSGGESLALDDSQLLMPESEAPTELGADSDFMLTPMDELADGEPDSSSQVIALDEENSDELIGAPPMLEDSAAPLLEEIPMSDAAPLVDAVPLEMAASDLAAPAADYSVPQQQAAGPATASMPEAPYTTLNILGLIFCTIILFIVGMMMYDLMRNMWSWNQPTPVNSWLMDLILGR